MPLQSTHELCHPFTSTSSTHPLSNPSPTPRHCSCPRRSFSTSTPAMRTHEPPPVFSGFPQIVIHPPSRSPTAHTHNKTKMNLVYTNSLVCPFKRENPIRLPPFVRAFPSSSPRSRQNCGATMDRSSSSSQQPPPPLESHELLRGNKAVCGFYGISF